MDAPGHKLAKNNGVQIFLSTNPYLEPSKDGKNQFLVNISIEMHFREKSHESKKM